MAFQTAIISQRLLSIAQACVVVEIDDKSRRFVKVSAIFINIHVSNANPNCRFITYFSLMKQRGTSFGSVFSKPHLASAGGVVCSSI